MYKHGSDGQIQQSYSDEEDTTFDNEDLTNLTDNIQTLNLENNHQHPSNISTNQTADSRSSSSLASSSRASSPFANALATNYHHHHQPLQTINDTNFVRFHDWNGQGNQFWSEQQLIMSDVLFQEGNF